MEPGISKSKSKTEREVEKLSHVISRVEKIESHLEAAVDREEKEIVHIQKNEKEIEKTVKLLGKVAIKRDHLLEFARGVAGAFFGVGLGQIFGVSVKLAATLPWFNIIGILLFIFILVGILIYRKDMDILKNKHDRLQHIAKRLFALYAIAIIVQLIGLFLFNDLPSSLVLLLKALIIGSFASMSAAAAFTLF